MVETIKHRNRTLLQRRWEFWKPYCLMYARATGATMEGMEATHRALITKLSELGIPSRTYRYRNLDDPRQSAEVAAVRIANALVRRKQRIGRKKGQRKLFDTLFDIPQAAKDHILDKYRD
jgi:hypothetical protein